MFPVRIQLFIIVFVEQIGVVFAVGACKHARAEAQSVSAAAHALHCTVQPRKIFLQRFALLLRQGVQLGDQLRLIAQLAGIEDVGHGFRRPAADVDGQRVGLVLFPVCAQRRFGQRNGVFVDGLAEGREVFFIQRVAGGRAVGEGQGIAGFGRVADDIVLVHRKGREHVALAVHQDHQAFSAVVGRGADQRADGIGLAGLPGVPGIDHLVLRVGDDQVVIQIGEEWIELTVDPPGALRQRARIHGFFLKPAREAIERL